MVSLLQALGYQTIILYLLGGIASIILGLTIYAYYSLYYFIFGSMGVLLFLEHTLIVKDAIEQRSNILFSAIFGMIVGIGAMLLNLHPIVPVLILGGTIFGLVSYLRTRKEN